MSFFVEIESLDEADDGDDEHHDAYHDKRWLYAEDDREYSEQEHPYDLSHFPYEFRDAGDSPFLARIGAIGDIRRHYRTHQCESERDSESDDHDIPESFIVSEQQIEKRHEEHGEEEEFPLASFFRKIAYEYVDDIRKPHRCEDYRYLREIEVVRYRYDGDEDESDIVEDIVDHLETERDIHPGGIGLQRLDDVYDRPEWEHFPDIFMQETLFSEQFPPLRLADIGNPPIHEKRYHREQRNEEEYIRKLDMHHEQRSDDRAYDIGEIACREIEPECPSPRAVLGMLADERLIARYDRCWSQTVADDCHDKQRRRWRKPCKEIQQPYDDVERFVYQYDRSDIGMIILLAYCDGEEHLGSGKYGWYEGDPEYVLHDTLHIDGKERISSQSPSQYEKEER